MADSHCLGKYFFASRSSKVRGPELHNFGVGRLVLHCKVASICAKTPENYLPQLIESLMRG